MKKLYLLGFALLTCSSLSCQSYTTGLQQSVARADETAATAALRAVAIAQQTYAVSNGGSYGTFTQLSAGGYLDERFNSEKPTIKDYLLTMEIGSGTEGPYYRCYADPVRSPQAGRHFYMDSTSTALHANNTQTASKDDPVTQP